MPFRKGDPKTAKDIPGDPPEDALPPPTSPKWLYFKEGPPVKRGQQRMMPISERPIMTPLPCGHKWIWFRDSAESAVSDDSGEPYWIYYDHFYCEKCRAQSKDERLR